MRTVAVLGAAGYAGAVASALLHRHPHFELAFVTARSDAGVRLDEVHPRSRVPLELEEYDPDRHSQVDAAVVAYPHGAAAPVVAELRERGVRVVDLSADFRLHELARLRGLVRLARRARRWSATPSTGCPSCTATRSPAPTWSPTPAATRPPRSSPSPRWRAPACSATW